MFFGSVSSLASTLAPSSDPALVLLRLHGCLVADVSAVAELTTLVRRYSTRGKAVLVLGVAGKSRVQARRSRAWRAEMHELAHGTWANAAIPPFPTKW